MPVDWNAYNAPGIYVEEDQSPLVSVVAASPPTNVALVGPSIGYRTNTEAVVLSGTTPVTLRKFGIDINSVVVTGTDGSMYSGSAYNLSVGGGADGDVSTLPDNTLDIVRSGSEIGDGASVFVSYHYTDVSYFSPQPFLSYEDVKDAYGEPIDNSTSAILSPLSLAAKIAFDNGCRVLTCVATAGSATAVTRDQLATGLNALKAMDVDLVVPLPVGITGTTDAQGDVVNVANDLKLHCEQQSDDQMYRVGVIGFESSTGLGPNTVAASVRSSRVMVAWPYAMSYYNGFVNQTITLSGYYLATAYAGMMASFESRESLTRKTVRGFSGIPASVLGVMTPTLKNSYSQSGVTVAEQNRDGALKIRHSVTTNPGNINNREMSVVRGKDALLTQFTRTFDAAQMIGTPIDQDTLARVKSVAAGVLEQAKGSGLILDYTGLAVRQRSIDPTVIEIKFQYIPAYPLNYIVISFGINMSTGSLDVIDQTP